MINVNVPKRTEQGSNGCSKRYEKRQCLCFKENWPTVIYWCSQKYEKWHMSVFPTVICWCSQRCEKWHMFVFPTVICWYWCSQRCEKWHMFVFPTVICWCIQRCENDICLCFQQ